VGVDLDFSKVLHRFSNRAHHDKRMNRIFLVFFFLINANLIFAQPLRTHTVDSQDTLESIARLYGVTANDILILNPDVKNQLNKDDVLVIPNAVKDISSKTTQVREVISYKLHRVKRKETLYSIAEKYDITIDDIKKHNQQLLIKDLQFKDKIYIPKYKTKTVSVIPEALQTYTVLPKEGKWRVAYKFGISVQELEALNPGLGDIIQQGQILNVPNIEMSDEQDVSDQRFGYYKVLPREGFYRLFKKLGISKDSLEQLNPVLNKTGLTEGMILKVPKSNLEGLNLAAIESTNLAEQLQYFEPKSIALVLPFKTNSVAFDSIELAKEQIKRDGYIRIATEFYSGVEMALDSAKRLGISTTMDVYDTQASEQVVRSMIETRDFSKYDFVLGPLTASNLTIVTKQLSKSNTAVVSPFVKLKLDSPNFIQSIPNDDWMADKLLRHAKKDTVPHKTLIISDSKNGFRSSKIRAAFPDANILTSERDENGIDQYYIDFETVQKTLEPGRTLVFLETNNESFASNVSSMLNGLNGITIEKDENDEDIEIEVERELILMTTNYNRAFMGNNISNTDLSNLKFQFASVHYSEDDFTAFDTRYKQKYGAYPTRYAIRGFDLTLDLLLRLAAFGSVYEQITSPQTTYLQNKFMYAQSRSGDGYVNVSAFILEYRDLYIVKLED
jgi:LysM repeat protein